MVTMTMTTMAMTTMMPNLLKRKVRCLKTPVHVGGQSTDHVALRPPHMKLLGWIFIRREELSMSGATVSLLVTSVISVVPNSMGYSHGVREGADFAWCCVGISFVSRSHLVT